MREMKDNRGFSLVELVIVLAIMAVLGSSIFYSYRLMIGQYARECANDLSAALNKEKNYALTRSATVDCYMELSKDSDGFYVAYYVPASAIATGFGTDDTDPEDDWVEVTGERKKIGKAQVDVKLSLSGGTSVTLSADQSVRFIYDRTNGSMKGIYIPDDPTVKGLSLDVSGNVNVTGKCEKITIVNGRTYEIEIYPATGKHVLSRVS